MRVAATRDRFTPRFVGPPVRERRERGMRPPRFVGPPDRRGLGRAVTSVQLVPPERMPFERMPSSGRESDARLRHEGADRPQPAPVDCARQIAEASIPEGVAPQCRGARAFQEKFGEPERVSITIMANESQPDASGDGAPAQAGLPGWAWLALLAAGGAALYHLS